MRVALLSRSAHPLHAPGGLERAVYHLARHLTAQGAAATLFTREATHAGAFPGDVVSVRYARLPFLAHGRILDRTLHYPAFAAALGGAVGERVRAGDFDIVHAQGLSGLGYARRRRTDPALRAPLVTNPQGMEEHKTAGLKRLALTRLRRLSREAARLSDRVIATDDGTRVEVTTLLGVPAERVVVIPNGVDLDEIREATPDDAGAAVAAHFPALANASPLLLSVGRLEAYKGFGDVQAALEVLAAQRRLPERARWAVVGDGPERARLAARPLAARRALLGRVQERALHALYERADVFVHATRFEGSSLVTLEAMAHARPVVATRAGGIPDKLDATCGRLVAPGDVAGLADALAELIQDAALRRRLGEAARRRVEARFGWPLLAARTLELYHALLRERAA